MSSIFDELSETAVQSGRETTPIAALIDVQHHSDELPTTKVSERKRGRPRKKPANTPAIAGTVEVDSEPKKPAITYYLTMYSSTQIQMVLSPELEFDTLKAQILEKISQSLKPKTIVFEHYSITWTIPHTQASSMPLYSPADYQFLLDLALKQKNPSVNLLVKTRLLKDKVRPCIMSGYMR
jgi:hypothetical protein